MGSASPEILPSEFETDALCAMAPGLMQRMRRPNGETNLGDLRSVTLSCAKAPSPFSRTQNLCLAALHASERTCTDEVVTRLARTTQELAQMYAPAEVA